MISTLLATDVILNSGFGYGLDCLRQINTALPPEIVVQL